MAVNRVNPAVQPTVVPFSGGQASAAAAGALNTAPVSNALSQWFQFEREKQEQRATIAATDRATLAQRELGTTALAAPEADLAQRFQLAQKAQAQEVLNAQLQQDAALEAQRLRNEHFNNPEAFQTAWSQWRTGVGERFREDDPAYAGVVEQYLDDVGTRQFTALADQKAARDRADRTTRALTALDGAKAAQLDMLLNAPDPKMFQRGLREQEVQLQGLQRSGLLTQQEVDAQMEANRVDYQRSYLRGVFVQNLENGDTQSALGILDQLFRGEHFEVQEQAWRLEDELRALLPKEQMDFEVSTLLSRLQLDVDGVLNGADETFYTREDIEAARPLIQAFGTAEQQEKFRVLAATLFTSQNVLSMVQEGSQDDALQAIQLAESRENRLELTTPGKAKLVSVGTERIATLNKARSSGDYASAAGADTLRTTTANLFTAPLPQLRELAAQQQQGASVALKRPASMISPWTNDQLNLFSESFTKAVGAGNADAADDALSRVAAPYQRPDKTFDVGLLMGDTTRMQAQGQMSMVPPVMLTAAGSPDLALGWSRALSTGTRLLNGPNATAVLRSIDKKYENKETLLADMTSGSFFGTTVSDAVNNIAGRDTVIRQALWNEIMTVTVGSIEADGDIASAKAEVERLLDPFMKGVTFSNGATMPSKFLAGYKTGDQAVVAEVNRFLGNPALIGVDGRAEAQIARIEPRILPGKQGIGFFDPQKGEFLRDLTKKDKPFIAVAPMEVAREAGTSPSDPENRPLAERAVETAVNAVNATLPPIGEALDVRNAHAAFKTTQGGDALAEAVFYGTQMVGKHSVQHTGTRQPPYFLRPELDGQYDREKIKTRLRSVYGSMGELEKPSVYFKAAQPIIAGMVMEDMEKAFPGDVTAQLAGYWLGADAVIDMQQKYGPGWASQLVTLDPGAHSFVTNARKAHGARTGAAMTDVLTSPLGGPTALVGRAIRGAMGNE